jgi:hypothetical protein
MILIYFLGVNAAGLFGGTHRSAAGRVVLA